LVDGGKLCNRSGLHLLAVSRKDEISIVLCPMILRSCGKRASSTLLSKYILQPGEYTYEYSDAIIEICGYMIVGI
jgi:hypothetical protein